LIWYKSVCNVKLSSGYILFLLP